VSDYFGWGSIPVQNITNLYDQYIKTLRSCYLTPATPASYIKGTATDNLPWQNRLAKVCRIHKNSAQNLQVTHEEFLVFFAEEL